MREIELRNGGTALVDDEDFERLSQFKWYRNDHGYAVRARRMRDRTLEKGSMRMHRHIMGDPPDGMVIDHIDRNRLNNQKENLRFCTYSENAMNSDKKKKTASKFKGVFLHVVEGRRYWRAKICVNRRDIRKVFPYTKEGEKEAAMWFNEQSRKHFGEFAYKNKVQL